MVQKLLMIKMQVHGLYVISSFNEFDVICLYIFIAIISTQSNGFKNCYLATIILFNINHSFAHREMITNIVIQVIILFSSIHSFTDSKIFPRILFF